MHGESNTRSSQGLKKDHSFLLPVFAFAAAFMFIAEGITHFLMPPEQIHLAHGITPAFFTSLAANPAAFHIHYWTGYSETIKAVILARGLDHIDPYGMAFNLTGIFVFYLSYRWFRTGDLPKWLTWTGMAGGVLLQFVLVGILTHTGRLIDLAAGLGGIVLFPLWLIGLGILRPEG